jgi:hypothetical protein
VRTVSDEAIGPLKTMRLRYAGRCRTCGLGLAVGTRAIYDRESKTVTCLTCSSMAPLANPDAAAMDAVPVPEAGNASEDPAAADVEIFAGVAGSSAQREYERRKLKRETRIRQAHPIAGGLILALSDDPQSTKAWAAGARGEERLGRRLDGLAGENVHVLHDRRIPPTRANIDHIVVCPSGVLVIDAKKYKGRPSLRVEGGLFRPRVEKLMVGSRDCTKLVAGVHKQLGVVTAALQSSGLSRIPVSGMLCFVEADWPLIGGDFSIAGLRVLWPRKAAGYIAQPGELDAVTAQQAHRALSVSFPSA